MGVFRDTPEGTESLYYIDNCRPRILTSSDPDKMLLGLSVALN